MKKIDLTGQRFGYLSVLHEDTSKTHTRVRWTCLCDCGNTTSVSSSDLRSGHTSSCGCKNYESKNFTHGMRRTKLYNVWCGMKKRCYNHNDKAYKHYGARGIRVCDQWLHDFSAFKEWADITGYRNGVSIERIDNNGMYEPSNCRWITMERQQRNKRQTLYLTIDGIRKPISDWRDELGLSRSLIESRYKSAIQHKGSCSKNDIINKPHYRKSPSGYFRRPNSGRKVAQFSKSGELIKVWDQITLVQSEGINPKCVYNCVRGRAKTACGYTWEYAD